MVRKMNTLTVRQNGSRTRVQGRGGGGGGAEAGAVTGVATLARWVAIAGDPRVTKVPKFDCKQSKRSIFLDLDEDDIRRLSGFLAKAELVLPDESFESTRKELTDLLNQFSAEGGTQYDILDPCSMPGHVANGSGGCKPSPHGNSFMISKNPPDPFFGKPHNGASVFAFGYVISVKYV